MFLLVSLFFFVTCTSTLPLQGNNISTSSFQEKGRPPALSQSRSVLKDSGQSRLTARLTCYDQAGFQGDRFTADEYMSSLGVMDNRIGSCCFTGIWILYAEQNYNIFQPNSANWYGYGNNACFDAGLFNNQASSLRYTGAPDDMYHDTVNLYFNEHFNGEEEYSYVDKPQLNFDNRALSLIVTGCGFWTLYSERYYQGYAVCVGPSNQVSCEPGFYSTRTSLAGIAGDISSLQRGCFSKRWLLPDNYQHLRRNNNNNNKNILRQSSTTQERDTNVKQVNEIKTADGWIGFSNLNMSRSAHKELVK